MSIKNNYYFMLLLKGGNYPWQVDRIQILCIELELVCTLASRGGIFSNIIFPARASTASYKDPVKVQEYKFGLLKG